MRKAFAPIPLLLLLAGNPVPGWCGPLITLDVDAREAARHLLHARLTIPVAPGALTLVYPKWLPGNHGPTGPVADLAGIRMSIDGKPVAWQRDSVDLYAFHLTVPDGARRLEVALDFLSGLPDAGLSSPASLTTELALLKWSQLVLYPAGANPDELEVETSLQLPAGWQFATALNPAAGDTTTAAIRFAPVSLSTLVDSPLLAGRYFQEITLDDSARPVRMAVAADSAAALKISPETGQQLRRMVRETDALFGARHFRRYTFLVALSDQVAQFGLESHESSENRVAENSFTNPAVGMLEFYVLPHEYVHSWNGKFRRPVGLATPDFQAPMRGDLLWVYEGLTQYLGHLLAARSGIWSAARYRDRLAQSAAYYSLQPGRRWRALGDTAIAAQQLRSASPLWRSYRRSADYYNEGALVWLEADMLIRQESGGRRSLDDFCKAFFGGQSGPPAVVTYTEDDIYAALSAVLPWDWRQFFTARITAINPPPPVGGLTSGGWRLRFGAERNGFLQDIETLDPSGMVELAYSLGIRVNGAGLVDDLILGTPADAAGIAPGMFVRAVNGRRWSVSRLREAIAAGQEDAGSKGKGSPISLLVENGDRFTTVDLRYADGLREPQLERLPSGPDRLGASIAPRAR
jgi:predicted metalloprotease with PDZ domain